MPTSSRGGTVYFHGWVNGKMLYERLISPSHSTYCDVFVGVRADVGIGPYILAELRTA